MDRRAAESLRSHDGPVLLFEKNKSRDDVDLSESKALEARRAARFTSAIAEPLSVRVGGSARVESSIGRSVVVFGLNPSSSGTTSLEDEPRRRRLAPPASSKVSLAATTIVAS